MSHIIGTFLYAGTRAAYTRPGLMMRVPTSSNKKAPYLFRAGVSTEFHNFNPFNTARGVYFETELGRGFSVGFSGVTPGDTTRLSKLEESTYNAPAEFSTLAYEQMRYEICKKYAKF